MCNLRDLLATWEKWSERTVNRRALANARTEEQRAVMRAVLSDGAEVDPLDVLRDVTQLVTLLSAWRWQVVRDARDAGAGWEQIATTIGLSPEQAEAEHVATIERQERYSRAYSR